MRRQKLLAWTTYVSNDIFLVIKPQACSGRQARPSSAVSNS